MIAQNKKIDDKIRCILRNFINVVSVVYVVYDKDMFMEHKRSSFNLAVNFRGNFLEEMVFLEKSVCMSGSLMKAMKYHRVKKMGVDFHGVQVTWYKIGINKEYTSRPEIRRDEPR